MLSENQLFKWNIQQTGQSVFQEKVISLLQLYILLDALFSKGSKKIIRIWSWEVDIAEASVSRILLSLGI